MLKMDTLGHVLVSIVGFILFHCINDANAVPRNCTDDGDCLLSQHCCERSYCCSNNDPLSATQGGLYTPNNPYDGNYRYTILYRFSIWNMWYFWFVVIFIMMSCFGGCGYWRRRQIFLARQRFSSLRGDSHLPTGNAAELIPPGPTYYYSQPPPYSEVVKDMPQYGVAGERPPPYPGNLVPHEEPVHQPPSENRPYNSTANQ